jgi:hypothetical protein
MVTVLTTLAFLSLSLLSSSWPCRPTFTVHILEKAADAAE